MRDLDFGKELIKKKIPLISNSPGVYRMLGKKNQVLYVGKAKNLPNRLKDYATGKNLPIRTKRMLALTCNLEIVTTSSEAEALLLEANLIKKFKPKFNILLKDDKSFPYIFIEKDVIGLSYQNIEVQKIKKVIILDHLLLLGPLIGQLKSYKKFFF